MMVYILHSIQLVFISSYSIQLTIMPDKICAKILQIQKSGFGFYAIKCNLIQFLPYSTLHKISLLASFVLRPSLDRIDIPELCDHISGKARRRRAPWGLLYSARANVETSLSLGISCFTYLKTYFSKEE